MSRSRYELDSASNRGSLDKLQKELSRLSDKTITVAESDGALLQDFDAERVALIEAAENEALATVQPPYSRAGRPVVG